MRSTSDWLVPVLFLVEGVFWAGIVGTGGAALLLLAALAFIASGVLLLAAQSSWITRPVAGASALFGLTLTVYQVYVAATLSGTSLAALGLSSGAVFAVFALLSAFLELSVLSTGGAKAEPSKAA